MGSNSGLKRFWNKVDKSGDCWLWTAGKDKDGYGGFTIAGEKVVVHRFSWELHFGEIPKGLHVLHKCDVRNCIRPDHLFLGTQKTNMADRNAKNRQAKGTVIHQSKLDEEIVKCIRVYYPMFTKVQLGLFFGVDRRTIYDVVNSITWK